MIFGRKKEWIVHLRNWHTVFDHIFTLKLNINT